METTTKFHELLSSLPKDIPQTEIDFEESLPSEIWENHFKDNYRLVAENLDVDRHRWYETSITVIEIFGHFLGIRHITNVYSESSGVDDCGWTLYFFEMEEVQKVTYKKKV